MYAFQTKIQYRPLPVPVHERFNTVCQLPVAVPNRVQYLYTGYNTSVAEPD
jgi:hypothetical protein